MKKRDKLDRYRTNLTALTSQNADVPFWVTLTPGERKRWSAQEIGNYYRRVGQHRKAFRDHVRGLCG